MNLVPLVPLLPNQRQLGLQLPFERLAIRVPRHRLLAHDDQDGVAVLGQRLGDESD